LVLGAQALALGAGLAGLVATLVAAATVLAILACVLRQGARREAETVSKTLQSDI